MSTIPGIVSSCVVCLTVLSISAVVAAEEPASEDPAPGLPDPAELIWEYGDGLTQPPPILSTFQRCLCRSPRNLLVDPLFQCTYAGTLRTESGPVENFPAELVALEIRSPCANPTVLNPDGPSGPDGVVIWGAAKLNQGGGACEGVGVVEILVNAQLFFDLDEVRSPDEDGDGTVGLADLVVWQQAFVTQSPRYQGDLNCDEIIALGDLIFWQHHFVGR